MSALEDKVIVIVPHVALPVRIGREIREAAATFLREPGPYLRAAFSPGLSGKWFGARLADELRNSAPSFVRHPLAFIKEAMGADLAGMTRRWILPWTLTGSFALHSVLLGYLFYAAV